MPFIKTAEIILSYISLFINMFIKYFVWGVRCDRHVLNFSTVHAISQIKTLSG